MPTTSFHASALWQNLIKERFDEASLHNLDTFRHEGLSSRLSNWEVGTNSMRYFKTLLYNEALRMNPEEILILKTINNRLVGSPITVTIDGKVVCIDYLQTAKEIAFIKPHIRRVSRILEIGAGFGRTCHGFMDHFADEISDYFIVDLPECLALSKNYLNAVLPENLFTKIKFIRNDQISPDDELAHDLSININSMAEMDMDVVKSYLDFIAGNARYFYSKNPVAKYSMSSLETQKYDKEGQQIALSVGPLQTIIDIFDTAAIEGQIPAFLSAYAPSPDWSPLAHETALPWTYYHQALFAKK